MDPKGKLRYDVIGYSAVSQISWRVVWFDPADPHRYYVGLIDSESGIKE